MSWIKIIEYVNASPTLKKAYDRVKGPNNYLDNVFKAHSLRPRTLLGHLTLYKNTIHNPANSLPKWYLEAIAVYVSYLNGCNYCLQHHLVGFKRLYPDQAKASQYLECLKSNQEAAFFEEKFLQGIHYTKRLTLNLSTVREVHVKKLKTAGFSDEEILELNQVIAYTNYGNRTSLGLGVSTKGDVFGVAPESLETSA